MLLLEQQRPRFVHAETMPAYMPKPRDPRMDESMRIAREINRLKVTDPEQGDHIYDRLVNQLLSNTAAMARSLEDGEDPNWTAPQRCVWRHSKLSPETLYEVIESKTVSNELTAFAQVNAGRWLVACPLSNIDGQPCGGAQYASFVDKRFFCVECNNQWVQRAWLSVIWPDDVSSIENLLLKRPQEHRHWLPHEPLDNLRRQNGEY